MQFPAFIVGSCYVYYIELSISTLPSRNESKNECSSVCILQVIYSMGFVYFVGQFSFFASYTTNTDDSVL